MQSARAVRLVATGPAVRKAWEEALLANPQAAVTQTPAWLDVLTAVRPYQDASKLYEVEGGGQVVLPMARRRRVPAPAAVEESWPEGWECGGLLPVGGTPTSRDVAEIVADLSKRPVLRTSIWLPPWFPNNAVCLGEVSSPRLLTMERTTHVVDLHGGFDVVWRSRFSGKVRTMCRKAERKGVTVESDCTGRLVSVFDALYRKSVERWAEDQREPVLLARWLGEHREPRKKFEMAARLLGDSFRVWIAWRGGEPLAGVIVMMRGTNATYWRGAMDKELVAGTGANELLHRLAIEEACESGCDFYDMGGGPSETLARFKSTFGAREEQYQGLRLEKLPLTAFDKGLRRVAKRVVGMRRT